MRHGEPSLLEHSTAVDCEMSAERGSPCRLVQHCLATFGFKVGAAKHDVWALEPRKARPSLTCWLASCAAPQPHAVPYVAAAGVPPAGRPAAD